MPLFCYIDHQSRSFRYNHPPYTIEEAHLSTAPVKHRPLKSSIETPRYVKDRLGVLCIIPARLDPMRCWLMKRPRLGHPGEQELILTRACLSSDPNDEDDLTNFLDRFGWKIALSAADKVTTTGRPEHFWFTPPPSLKDHKQVLEAIQHGLRDCRGGFERLKEIEAGFRAGKLHLVTSLDV